MKFFTMKMTLKTELLKLSSVAALVLTSCLAEAKQDTSYVSHDWHCWAGASRTYQVPVSVLKAIAMHESGFNYKAVGPKNDNGSVDYGLMQINSSWVKPNSMLSKKGITKDQLLNDPCLNLYIGAWILKGNINQYGSNWKAVGAYNARSETKRISYAQKIGKNIKKLEGRS